jgi:metal-dependent hydrolase (beta-lactamase superfamily II)
MMIQFREGIVNFRNTFRSHAQQVVKEAIKEVVAGVSLQDSTKLERQTVRSIKEFVHDALVESQCAFFKMSEVLVKKGKKVRSSFVVSIRVH